MTNYDILGVSPTASKEEIKKAYHKLSLLHHPDRPNGNQEKFVKIKDAYEALSQFKPNNTHNIFTQYKEESYIIVHHHFFNHNTCSLSIHASFSRDMLFAKVMGKRGIKYSWHLIGLNSGNFNLDKEFLIECKFKFDIYFVTNSGKTIIKSFNFDDPRSKKEIFKDKYLSPEYFVKTLCHIMILMAMYYLVKNFITHT